MFTRRFVKFFPYGNVIPNSLEKFEFFSETSVKFKKDGINEKDGVHSTVCMYTPLESLFTWQLIVQPSKKSVRYYLTHNLIFFCFLDKYPSQIWVLGFDEKNGFENFPAWAVTPNFLTQSYDPLNNEIFEILGSIKRTVCGKLICVCNYSFAHPNFSDTKSYGPRKSQNFAYPNFSEKVKALEKVFTKTYGPRKSQNFAYPNFWKSQLICVSKFFWHQKLWPSKKSKFWTFKSFWHFSRTTLPNLRFWLQSKLQVEWSPSAYAATPDFFFSHKTVILEKSNFW